MIQDMAFNTTCDKCGTLIPAVDLNSNVNRWVQIGQGQGGMDRKDLCPTHYAEVQTLLNNYFAPDPTPTPVQNA